MTEDLAETARDELKRADHSIFVSLKYARTVDIIKNTIKRLISAIDVGIMEICEYLKTKKKIKVVPAATKLRADLVTKAYPQTKEYIAFYYLLKDIDHAKYDKREEFRKNVELIALIGAERKPVNIEILKEYYRKTVSFIDLVDEITGRK